MNRAYLNGLRVVAATEVFDPTYRKVLKKAKQLGYNKPSKEQQIKQNQLVVDLKAANIWERFDVFYVHATDAGIDFTNINWVNPDKHLSTVYGNVGFITNVGTQGLSTDVNSAEGYIGLDFSLTNDLIKASTTNAGRGIYLQENTSNQNRRRFAEGLSIGNGDSILLDINIVQQRIGGTSNIDANYIYPLDKNLKTINRNSTDITLSNGKSVENRTSPISNFDSSEFTLHRRGNNYGDNTISIFYIGKSMVGFIDDMVDIFENYLNSL